MATKETRRKAANAIKNLRGPAKAKFDKIMREFGNRTLRSSTGETVTSQEQAVAIALSGAREARRNG